MVNVHKQYNRRRTIEYKQKNIKHTNNNTTDNAEMTKALEMMARNSGSGICRTVTTLHFKLIYPNYKQIVK